MFLGGSQADFFLSFVHTDSVTLCALVYRIRSKLWFCFLSIWSKHCFPRFSLHGTGSTGYSGLLWVSGNSRMFTCLIFFFIFFLFIDVHMFSLSHVSSCLDIIGALLKTHYWNMSILYFFWFFFRQWRRHPGGSRIWWWCKVGETRAACCGDWRLGWAR